MDLASLTPEGKIVLTLKHGKHTYNELKFETGLSDRWLTVKLEELEGRGVVEKSGRWYGLVGRLDVPVCELSLYRIFQAKRMASELARLSFVKMIVLFGSVARKRGDELSDLDMMIVVGKPFEMAKMEVLLEISKLEMKYHVMIEPLILDEKDFLDNVYSREGGIVYGVAEGFEVLVGKESRLAKILHDRVEEIKRDHEYLREAGIWLRVK